ncbi:MAG: RluA family pseudouridine synthase [Bdellovibrionia bacterium]
MATQSLQILFEDDDLLAVFKPSGLNSQPTVDKKKANVYDLLKKEKEVYLHHRLDKETSGVMLLGKSKRANKPLGEMFQQHSFVRTYWALAKKKDYPESWCVENYLRQFRHKGQLKQQVRKSGGDYAKTEFKKLEEFDNSLLIQAQPITGRMHQIRIHLACEQTPIWGDNLYGGKCDWVPRLMLHAYTMEFTHPFSHERLIIRAPLAKDFETVLHNLRNRTLNN